MSTLTSSVINKSGKTVAPKVIARRRPGRGPAPQPTSQAPTDPAEPNVEPTTASTEDARPATQERQLATPPPTQATQPTQEAPAAAEIVLDQSTDESRGVGVEEERPIGTTDVPTIEQPTPEGADREPNDNVGPPEERTQTVSRPVPETQPAAQDGDAEVASQAETLFGAAGNRASRQSPSQVAGVKRKRKQAPAKEIAQTPQEDPSLFIREETQQAEAGAERPVQEEQTTTEADAQPKPRKKRQKKQQLSDERITVDDDDQVVNAEAQAVPPPKKPRARKKKVVASTEGQDGPTENGEGENREQTAAAAKPKRVRKKKATPVASTGEGEEGQEGQEPVQEEPIEDPELHEIDVNATTMNELIRDRGFGKTSERGRKMAEIDWTEVVRKRREAKIESTPAVGETNDPGSTQGEGAEAGTPSQNHRGIQLRMVNGEMVFDDETQRIDRQAEAIAEASRLAALETPDDLTRTINRMTWIEKKKRDPAERVPIYKMKSDPWSDEDTDRFYEALTMFGTDFFIISKMFQPKTRRQMKLKFVREERLDPDRINRALSGENAVPMDLDMYAEATGADVEEFRDPRELEEELEREGLEQREEIEKKRAENLEGQKQRDIQMEAREKEKEERDRQKDLQKAQRAMMRAAKRRGGVVGSGTF